MKTLLEAKTILLLAFGAAKSTAVEAIFDCPPTRACPASFLYVHPDTRIFIDTAAAACLPPSQDLREAGETVADTDVV